MTKLTPVSVIYNPHSSSLPDEPQLMLTAGPSMAYAAAPPGAMPAYPQTGAYGGMPGGYGM